MPFKLLEPASKYLYLSAFAILGVLTRVYVDQLFNNGCYNRGGLCLTSAGTTRNSYGAYFVDLFSNCLGCYIMGCLAKPAALGIESSKLFTILPAGSVLQAVPALHLGLTTGFCGSLTTFASWQYQLVANLIGGRGRAGGQWAQWLWGEVVGLELPLACFVAGEHACLLLNHHVTPERTRGPIGARLEAAEDVDDEQEEEAEAPAGDEARNGPSGDTQDKGDGRRAPRGGGARGRAARWALGSAAGLLLAALLALFAALAAKDTDDVRRAQWFAILLAPPGCLLRYELSRLNGRLPGRWAWLPAGTLAANTLGCIVVFAVQGVVTEVAVPLSYWGSVLISAVRLGFSGALSTVSTYILEVRILHKDVPRNVHGHLYAWGSIFIGVLCGIVIYGSAVWTHDG